MSEQKPDLYRVTGKMEVDHDIRCGCEEDDFNLTNGEYWISATVSARSEEEAAQKVLDDKADDLGVTDKDCYHWHDDDEPTVVNVSQQEREKALLTAWNAGWPIRSK